MNPPNEIEETDALPEWHDPFPEPNTIPAGWDLSESNLQPVVAEPDQS